MIRHILRAYIPVAIIAAIVAGVLCLPDGSKMAMSEREPAWLIWTWKGFAGSVVAIILIAIRIHRFNDLLKLYKLDSLHLGIQEADARREAPN